MCVAQKQRASCFALNKSSTGKFLSRRWPCYVTQFLHNASIYFQIHLGHMTSSHFQFIYKAVLANVTNVLLCRKFLKCQYLDTHIYFSILHCTRIFQIVHENRISFCKSCTKIENGHRLKIGKHPDNILIGTFKSRDTLPLKFFIHKYVALFCFLILPNHQEKKSHD